MTIEEAYAMVYESEKDLVTELSDFAAEFKTKLAEIKAKQPSLGGTSAARQYLTSIENTFNSVFTYSLDSVRNSYGMSTSNSTVTNPPVYTPVA